MRSHLAGRCRTPSVGSPIVYSKQPVSSFSVEAIQAAAQVQALQVIRLPGAVLNVDGNILAANYLFNAMMPSFFQQCGERLIVTQPAANELFCNAVVALRDRDGHGAASIPIEATLASGAMLLHLVPLCAATEILTPVPILAMVNLIERAAVPDVVVLQRLFKLTPAEARVARGIGMTLTIGELARTMNVTRETIRTQLKSVLGKTGVNRQAELVALLAGKALPDHQITAR